MKLFKQPWFLIALFLLSVYTYYLSDSSISISTNKAMASEKTSKEKNGEETESRPLLEADFSQSFKARKIKSIKVATYQNLNFQFLPHDGEDVVLEFSGKGRLYKGEGKEFKDWLRVSLKRKTLKIESYSFNGNKNGTMKIKDFFGKSEEKLQAVIRFPKTQSFKAINVESVSSNVVTQGLIFNDASVESVSGNVEMSGSTGQSLEMATVSGDLKADKLDVQKGAFKSVSGDSRITTLVEKPDFSFSTVSGDVRFGLPASAQVNVDFNTMTGELKNEFGSSSGESGKVKISSLSGDAEVTKIK